MQLRSAVLLACSRSLPHLAVGREAQKGKLPPAKTTTRRGTTTFEVTATIKQAHDAAFEELAKYGCNIKKDVASEIHGERPKKGGVAAGSGAEKLFVSIKELDEGEPQIAGRNQKTKMRILGQSLE